MHCVTIVRRNLINTGLRNLWLSNSQFVNQTRLLSDEKTETGESKNQQSDDEYENNIKTNILNESLNYVKQFGWSREAISAGAESMNYPGVIHGLFPNGAADLIHHFNLKCNEKLNEEMQKYVIEPETNTLKKLPEAIVEEAMQKRLEMIIPFKQEWPQALAIMSIPTNIPLAFTNITTIVDNICYYAGDRSVDMNWYIRRAGVAGIYKTTELYMLQDSSEDHKSTWEFLNRRIKEAVEMHKISDSLTSLPQPEQFLNRTRDIAGAIFGTAQNIMGLNTRK